MARFKISSLLDAKYVAYIPVFLDTKNILHVRGSTVVSICLGQIRFNPFQGILADTACTSNHCPKIDSFTQIPD